MRTHNSSVLERIPDPVRLYFGRRLAESAGLLLLVLAGCFVVALMSWSALDPSLNYAASGRIRNLLGKNGAVVSDLSMQLFGLASIGFIPPILGWAVSLLSRRRLDRVAFRILCMVAGVICAAAIVSLFPSSGSWPLPTGLGGVIGDAMLALPRRGLGGSTIVVAVFATIIGAIAIVAFTAAMGRVAADEQEALADEYDLPPTKKRARAAAEPEDEEDRGSEPGLALTMLGGAIHLALRGKANLARLLTRRKAPRPAFDERDEPELVEPRLRAPAAAPPETERKAPRRITIDAPVSFDIPVAREAASHDADDHDLDLTAESRVAKPPAAIKPGKRASREAQPSFLDRSRYELPPLLLLSEAKKLTVGKLSEDALEQNARLLEGVLDDFGVKGEIINVRPGPVVTLYELEPAPGIKSSRVIGLADDIARSMSAVSARVAVVQGRNAIGIELPNQRRETVYLRELLASEDFEKSKHRLTIALGKTIGGEPVIVDLARMPHLLVAGTTGSGKSVAINTMILSLLYRLKPDDCKLIMIDPKMLELSVYDGIPHLLTPVVTDPKKAVVALKWAVREMEDRYKKMSKVGVRNIDGFNARVTEAAAKGEIITRTVQTGYDRETGEAIFESEEMKLDRLPFIVVIVDEMADLMMVAGKDIEGAIQRLAQMARAAGIHLIMATQRPSVDVITGTIKANFPTRISFQVTSKIDSRTILGEQGAEQLLGQGDMLYMAGGGRISRVHGPFVSDQEVEKIVGHLKTQGTPEYLEAITADDDSGDDAGGGGDSAYPGSMDAEESSDYYDRAVAIVLRDRKCSTSYIQRRLSVGYNKAASLVERMEQEGLISAANHAGKREILVGGGVDRGAFEPGPDD
ncbi:MULTISPECIES: DNA translocase FtsK [unclassified Beijerinckia]|uniref:DNA translocase FtsK n=1 Tax=unclassified Beijerinckia TaxID=2638183 RepID=UPI00089A4E7B|nr:MULTISPECIES: DNA translocase FtsK [unclassified Beijerinckia]MDH7798015.1 S-DNA-T family DNA segregation ATPase FtsK/SpoIIIE [Beijerinckia sp. GAS462]SED06017.1 DNA translocase FtsK [Beijerinckia sp. 28-YEA-48]